MVEPARQPDQRLAEQAYDENHRMQALAMAAGRFRVGRATSKDFHRALGELPWLLEQLVAREQQLQDKIDELYDVERERDAAWQRVKRAEQQLASLREAAQGRHG